MIGKKISKYEIESKLGQGGMGVVYKARDLTLPRHVAIKLLPPFMSTEGDARVRFEDEAKTTAALNHPNIADIYETGETDDGQLYIVMPLYEGRTLQDVLDEGLVDLDRALDLFMQLATGLAKAHEKGIVHRDIKPDNVFVTEDGFVKILDFGLARFAHSTRRTATGVSVGTVQYMSPEQARGDNAGPASDVFALGEILYQLVSGEYPFQAEHNQAILYKIMNEDPAPVTQAGVPDYVLRVIDGALEKDPADRFVDAAELLRVLKGGVPMPRKASKRPRWLMPAAIAFVAALAVVYLVFRGPGLGGPDDTSQATLEAVTPGALVVFPFTVRGSEEAGYLREGMVDLINVGLNDVAGIYPVDARAVHQAIQREDRDLDEQSMLRVTHLLRASMYIEGNVIEAGGGFQANASLYDAEGEEMAVATARVDSEAGLFDLAEEIARQVIIAYAGADAAGPRRLETSLAALKPFLQAEQLMRSGNFVDAMPLYQQSVAADSLFALGWMRYSLVTGYTEYTDISREASVRTMELSDQLTESELLKTRALHLFGFGELEEAMAIAQSLLQTHPHDPDVWFIYGDAIFHSWPLRGGDGVESYQSFLRAVENGMPRTDYGFMFHLRAAAAWGDLEAYNEILDELIVLQPHGDLANWVHAEIGAWRDDSDQWARGLGGLLGDPDWLLLGCANSFAIYQQSLDPAREVALLLTDPRRAPTIRAQGHLTAAFIDAARGRLGAAEVQMELAMANDPIYAAEYVALLALMPLPDAKERQQVALATVLGANVDGYRPDPSLDPWSDSHAGLHDIVLGTARASLYIRLDRVEDAAAEARALESYEGEELAVETAHGLAEGIRAELALAAGDTATAIALLERTWIAGHWERAHMTGYFSRARERLVIARVYAALDDVENALRWYNTAGRMSGYDAIFMASSYLESAMLLERHGRTEEAARYYTRFIELWDGCDEALAPQVADARQRLSQL